MIFNGIRDVCGACGGTNLTYGDCRRCRLDDHRVQHPDDEVDGERGRQQGGPRRMAGAEPQHGRQRSQQADGYLRARTVSPLYGGRMFTWRNERVEKKKSIIILPIKISIKQ